jgi:hypothetical protein
MNQDSTRQRASLNRSRTHLLAVVSAALLAASVALPVLVGTASAAFASAPPSLAKSYTGSARNVTAAESSSITLSGVTQNGGAISGTFTFHAPLAGTGPFTGTISSSIIRFEVKPTAASCASCTNIIFTASVSPLVSMNGTWVAHLKSGASQNGTWAVGSTWNGIYHSVVANQTGTMSLAAIKESATGAILGSVIFVFPSGGGTTLPITGSVHGSAVKFTYNSGGSLFTFTGTFSTALGGMSGSYTSAADHGAWQVHRSGATSTAV